ncbi:MAG TPA: hypothetical protein VKD89_00300 [Candidatus Udaeobacter sp.]|nr:hypothetical protein [Candidatus Udaeobacter sp.]
MRFIALIAMTFVAGAALTQSSAALLESPTPASAKPAVDQLIPWLLDENQQLRGIAFGEVIFDTTGKKVLPFDANNAIDQRVAKAISAACDETMRKLNAPDSAIQNVDRINEVSGHFEESLRELLNTTPGLRCDFPLTAEGKCSVQGYPDLRVTDVESKRVFYLDPKLYLAGSRDSTFRAFYFEPKKATNKVCEDAVHFVVGFEHEARVKNGVWKFMRWDLVDLSRFTVKLKAEFQGSNRDMYRPESIVASSAKR